MRFSWLTFNAVFFFCHNFFVWFCFQVLFFLQNECKGKENICTCIVKGFTILFQKTIMHLPDSNLHISLDRLVFIIKSNVTLIQQCGIKWRRMWHLMAIINTGHIVVHFKNFITWQTSVQKKLHGAMTNNMPTRGQ